MARNLMSDDEWADTLRASSGQSGIRTGASLRTIGLFWMAFFWIAQTVRDVDEFGEKQKQEKRAKEIRAQEREVIRRRKKSLTSTQIKHRKNRIVRFDFAAVLIIGVILDLTSFKTEKIEVVGDKYYDEKQIDLRCGVEYQENIYGCNVQYIGQGQESFVYRKRKRKL